MIKGIGIEAPYTYLALDLFCILGPLLLSFDKRVAFFRLWRPWFLATIPISVLYLIWDIIFTKNSIWSFNADYLIGLEWSQLPLEEWMFFLVVPYATVFIYECLIQYFPALNTRMKKEALAWQLLAIASFTMAIWNLHQWYTFVTFGLLGFCLALLQFSRLRLKSLFIAWLICLIPMAMVNGVLTSLPVVIYNNSENLSFRIGSIPFEDFFYHLLYMAAILGLYESQLKRQEF